MASRVKQESQEGGAIPISKKLQEREEVGTRGRIFSPVVAGSSCGCSQAKALSSGKVREGPRSVWGAARYSAGTTIPVTRVSNG